MNDRTWKRLCALGLAIAVVAALGVEANGPDARGQEGVTVSVDAGATTRPLEPAFGLGLLGFPWDLDRIDPVLLGGMRQNMWRFGALSLNWYFPDTLMPPATPSAQEWSFFDAQIRDIARDIKEVADTGAVVATDVEGMPRWLSSCAENEGTLPQIALDDPLWRHCAPNDAGAWEDLVARVVTIFSEEGLSDFYWGVWNEPEWTFYGTEAEYLELYASTARAVRAAEPLAKVGGTNDVSLLAQKWQYNKHDPVVDYGTLSRAPEPLMRSFLEYVALEELPLDFIDWHFPTTDPRSQALEDQLAQAQSWLSANGLPPDMPVRIGEWTVEPCGDETAGELSAAYVVSMLVEMARVGIALQNHTSLLDQDGWADGCWTHVGLFSAAQNRPAGVARAKYNAFRFVSRLQPERLPVVADDPYLDVVATKDAGGEHVTLLLSNYVNPSPGRIYQMVRAELLARGIVTPQELADFDQCVADRVALGQTQQDAIAYCVSLLPPAKQAQIDLVMQETLAAVNLRKTAPVTTTVSLDGLSGDIYGLTRYSIDWEHANVCRYNKRTEPAPTTSGCGQGGAVDQRWDQAVAPAEAATVEELLGRGWTQADLLVLEQQLLVTCPAGSAAQLQCVAAWFAANPNSFSKPDSVAMQDLSAAANVYTQTLAPLERAAAAELNALPDVGVLPVEQAGVLSQGGHVTIGVTLIPNGVSLIELTPLAPDADSDGDGCTNAKELGLQSQQGGRRSPLNPWDFYDVYGPGQTLPRDRVIDLANDILAVIQHYAPTGASPYDAQFDRGPQTGANVWNMSAPDGVIDLANDILGVILQYLHNCS